jgi:nucleoside-diphosphate-sugar epimerase
MDLGVKHYVFECKCCSCAGDQETVNNGPKNLVDVRDVADALLLTYENPQASGRYLCSSTAIRVSDIVNILKTSYPTYTYPQK